MIGATLMNRNECQFHFSTWRRQQKVEVQVHSEQTKSIAGNKSEPKTELRGTSLITIAHVGENSSQF